METGTPQYSRSAHQWRAIALGRSTLAVPVAEERGEAGQPRIDLVVVVRMITLVELQAARRAQPWAIGTAERVHRLGECELVMEGGRQLDVMVLVDPLDGVLLGRRDGDRRSAQRVDRRNELLGDWDRDLLDEGVGAARAGAA